MITFNPTPAVLDCMNDINNERYMSSMHCSAKIQAVKYTLLAQALYLASKPIQILVICNSENDVLDILRDIRQMAAAESMDIDVDNLAVHFNDSRVDAYVYSVAQVLAHHTDMFMIDKVIVDISSSLWHTNDIFTAIRSISSNNLDDDSDFRQSFIGISDNFVSRI